MTLIARYPSKKACKEAIGQQLKFTETSMFGSEYKSNGDITVCNRPHITKLGREWFGIVTMENDLIKNVK